MTTLSIIKQALGSQWLTLPQALKAHYASHELTADGICLEDGYLHIHYPIWMQPLLSLMGLFGVLINRRAEGVKTCVKKWMVGETQYWKRTMTFADGRITYFSSYLEAADENQVIEYVNAYLGLQMAVSVQDDKVLYQGVHYVLKLGNTRINIPNYLALGKCNIEESAVDDAHFRMDFTLTHPVFGQIFQYKGIFKTCMPSDLTYCKNISLIL